MRNKQQVTDASKTAGGKFTRPLFGGENDFRVTFTPSTSGLYTVFLDKAIHDTSQFQEAVEALEAAGENDVVMIHLSTPGGSLDATDTFLTAMKHCNGRVMVNATGGVHSAGTMILLAAPEYRLSDNFNALVHNGSMGSYDKTSDVIACLAFQAKYMTKLAKSTYKGFMTEEEIDQMIAGKDFWFDKEEFELRLKKRDLLEAISEESEENLVDSEDED